MSDEYKHVTASIYWHLTPTGWVAGTSKDEDDEPCAKPIPADRVLTLFHETAGSEMRGRSEKTKLTWQTEDLVLLDRLKLEFGAKPASFWFW